MAVTDGPLGHVAVFCGSREGDDPVHLAAARKVGALLGERDIALVYGGGELGMMGALADAALAAGGQVIGVLPEHLTERERPHPGITDLRIVPTMHDRKALMFDLAEAFVTLPGAYGTLDELFDVLTWSQLGLHAKPTGLLDVKGYYRHLVAQLDHLVAEGFLRPEHRALLIEDDDPGRLLDRLAATATPVPEAWLGTDDR